MTEQIYVYIVIALIVALVALQVLQTLNARKASEDGRGQYPAKETNDLVQMLLQVALDLSAKTTTTVDDAGVLMYIRARGWDVTNDAQGRQIIVIPPMPEPAPTPPPGSTVG